ncbi:MAG: SUMF1/EgtB/PvdO family nonheme iron enzyme [Pseudomonadota bacterium]
MHNCTDAYVYAAPVGNFKPNKLGLYDILGNLWEWTCSKYESKYDGQELRCAKNINKNQKLSMRGGSWFDDAIRMRSAGRSKAKPSNRYVDVGLRLARL